TEKGGRFGGTASAACVTRRAASPFCASARRIVIVPSLPERLLRALRIRGRLRPVAGLRAQGGRRPISPARSAAASASHHTPCQPTGRAASTRATWSFAEAVSERHLTTAEPLVERSTGPLTPSSRSGLRRSSPLCSRKGIGPSVDGLKGRVDEEEGKPVPNPGASHLRPRGRGGAGADCGRRPVWSETGKGAVATNPATTSGPRRVKRSVPSPRCRSPGGPPPGRGGRGVGGCRGAPRRREDRGNGRG